MPSETFTFQGRPLVDLTDRIVRHSAIHIDGGAFGDVYKCRRRDTSGYSSLVAVKTLRYFESEDRDENRRRLEKLNNKLRRELGLLRRLEHPNIVYPVGVTQGFGQLLAAVSPWMSNGTLHSFLKKNGQMLTVVDRLQLLRGIASGLEYLHSKLVFHGDLHSGNVLIDEKHSPLICDFGLASTIGKLHPGLTYLQRSSNNPGAARWAAPERLSGCEPDPSGDIYSFGCLMFEVMSGNIPWKGKNEFEVIALKLNAHRPPSRPIDGTMEDRHWALMVRCWLSPQRRPTARNIVAAVDTFFPPLPSVAPSKLFSEFGAGQRTVYQPVADHPSRTLFPSLLRTHQTPDPCMSNTSV